MSNFEIKWRIKFVFEKKKTPTDDKTAITKGFIYMYVTFGKVERLRFYAREMVFADQLDTEYLKKAKADRNYFRPIKPQIADSREINGRLEAIAGEAVRLIEFAQNSNPPIMLTTSYLRTGLKAWLDKDKKPEKEENGVTLAEAMDEYEKYSALHHAAKTVAGFKQIRANIEGYIKSVHLKDVRLSDIDQAFVDGFDAFLINKINGNGKHYSNNTYAKNLKKTNTFILWCKNKGWFEGSVKIRWKENPGAILFLTLNEFATLADAKFENIAHDRIRDIFIFGIMTGLRYGQLRELKKINFTGSHIHYHDHKKGVFKPKETKLEPRALAIVEKYKNYPGEMLLPAFTNPNVKLKEVFVAAKIERMVNIAHKYADGKVDVEVVPLSKVAHSHMQRKTFITFAILLGMPDPVTKSITGHSKDSKSFDVYHDILDTMKDDAMDATFGKL